MGAPGNSVSRRTNTFRSSQAAGEIRATSHRRGQKRLCYIGTHGFDPFLFWLFLVLKRRGGREF
jgi:hypothetical protein